MNRVRVDPERRTAWCGGGANWGEVDHETQAFGLAVTGGRLADTGVGGLTLGGGSGWLERKYGLTVDSLLSAEVVTADGRLLVASADRNPDLFWALKGGGGNFGVVTGFEFALHEVGPLLYGGMLLFPIDAAVDLLKAYRGFMEDAPDEICGGSAILCAPPEEFVPEEVRGKPVLAVIALLRRARRGRRARVRAAPRVGRRPRDARADAVQAVQSLIAPGNPPGRHHYWKAGLLGELEDEAIETFVAHASDVVSPFTASLMLPFGGMVARAPEGDTPLEYRDAKWNYHLLGQWADPAEAQRNVDWVRAFDQAMAEYAEAGVYVNYVADPSAGALEAGFGPDNYARLVEIKREYDPENVFHNNSNIPPAASGASVRLPSPARGWRPPPPGRRRSTQPDRITGEPPDRHARGMCRAARRTAPRPTGSPRCTPASRRPPGGIVPRQAASYAPVRVRSSTSRQRRRSNGRSGAGVRRVRLEVIHEARL